MESDPIHTISRRELPGLRTRSFGRPTLYLERVDSTNQFLKERAAQLPSGTVLRAGEQTAGRGRMGRIWTGGGKDIPFSLLIRAQTPLPALSLCCGLAVAQGLTALVGGDFGIKWPNDIICGRRKICGILCESRPAAGGVYMICGMGINRTQTEEDFRRAGLPHAGSIAMQTGQAPAPEAVMAAVLNALEPLYDALVVGGFGAIKDAFADRCVTLGRQVQVLEGTRTACGRAVGLADDGSLLVAFPDRGGETRPIQAGEASVRGLLGYT